MSLVLGTLSARVQKYLLKNQSRIPSNRKYPNNSHSMFYE